MKYLVFQRELNGPNDERLGSRIMRIGLETKDCFLTLKSLTQKSCDDSRIVADREKMLVAFLEITVTT